MERTVPSTGSEEIELYLRTYYSLLRTTSEIQLRTLEEAHSGMKSLLHPLARDQGPDMSAFIYSLLRLPKCISQINRVILGQSTHAFQRAGIGDLEGWQVVTAPARRRRCYFDRMATLACFIVSRTDIDDIIPLLIAFQIEWNKIHALLNHLPATISFEEAIEDREKLKSLADHLRMDLVDLQRLQVIWGAEFVPNVRAIQKAPIRIKVQLLGSSISGYRRATHTWWEQILNAAPDIQERPVYFVSSNTHSLVNLLTGFALRHQKKLIDFVDESGDEKIHREWQDIQTRQVPSSQENFLYYLLKTQLNSPYGNGLRDLRDQDERGNGITRVNSLHYFDIDAQVIDLSKLIQEWIDPRLNEDHLGFLATSDAMILNIDYPLGLAAYNILTKLSEHLNPILGVYVMGKAATLNGVIGDVMIPNVVHDEHSRNTYLFSNCFLAADVSPYLVYGTSLDHQKLISVRGTFLQNTTYMDVFYREGYTTIEMEAGPYLSALYEMFRPQRHPVNEIVNLYEIPVDVGFLHYASDTPMSKGKNLGAASMSYFGMDPTYATSIAILRRIFSVEKQRLRSRLD